MFLQGLGFICLPAASFLSHVEGQYCLMGNAARLGRQTDKGQGEHEAGHFFQIDFFQFKKKTLLFFFNFNWKVKISMGNFRRNSAPFDDHPKPAPQGRLPCSAKEEHFSTCTTNQTCRVRCWDDSRTAFLAPEPATNICHEQNWKRNMKLNPPKWCFSALERLERKIIAPAVSVHFSWDALGLRWDEWLIQQTKDIFRDSDLDSPLISTVDSPCGLSQAAELLCASACPPIKRE